MTMKLFTLGSLLLTLSTGFSATITIDSVTRTVSSHVTGGTSDSASSSLSGSYDIEASTADGVDFGSAVAGQNTFLSGGSSVDFFNEGDIVVRGSRGTGFAPVNVASESLVDFTFTIPEEVGASAFVFEGFYTVIGGVADGTPSVSWNFASRGETVIGGAVLGGTLSSGTATSGSSEPINASGLLWPGTYDVTLQAKMGSNGSGIGSFTTSGAFGAAAFQDMRLIVTPLSPVPEPSSTLLLAVGTMLVLRRRR